MYALAQSIAGFFGDSHEYIELAAVSSLQITACWIKYKYRRFSGEEYCEYWENN